MEQLRCVVERITYQNPENGYTVIKCRAKGFSDLVTVVGSMADIHVGSVLSLSGNWKIDGKYGRQFSMESYEETLPATPNSNLPSTTLIVSPYHQSPPAYRICDVSCMVTSPLNKLLFIFLLDVN